MDLPDTKIVVYDDSEDQDSPGGESDGEDDEKGFQEFLSKIRLQNKAGPIFIYGDERDRNIREPRRLIKKSGKYNVSRHVESQIRDKYLRDLCNTLVHSRWRWTVIAASASFVLTWLMFGVIWMLVGNANGDADLQDNALKCLVGIQGFAGYFMLSLETQTTIGYGGRSLNDHCPEVIFVVCFQIILGVAICGLTVNIVYIKLTKSHYRYTKLFSKHAVICRRDGDLCLIFRVRDEDSRHAICTTITAYILRKDKETCEPYLEHVPLEPYGFLIWPLEIVHKITPTSPLWDISSYNILSEKFEVIVTLQGTSPTTAQCSKTRTSYISSEILWGHKFKNCIKYLKKDRKYVVNQRHFNLTEEFSTHLCSAKRFAEVYNLLSPTPTQKNYRFKVNIMCNGTQRRGTLVSVETMDGSNNKIDDQSLKSKGSKEKMADEDKERENKRAKPVERPSVLNLAPDPNNRSNTFSARSINVSKPEVIAQHSANPYENNWEYQNYSGNHLPDFWLKEAASLPLINNYNQDRNYKTRKFDRLRIKSLHVPSEKLNESKGLLNHEGVFEGEEFIFENNTSANESNMSLISSEYPRSDMDIEHDRDLDAMLRSMESYLEQNSMDNISRASSPFPKS